MTTKRVARYNTPVLETLQSRLESAPQSEFSECRLFDTDGSKYLLQREQDVFRVSFSLAGFADNVAVSTNLIPILHELQTRHESICRVSTAREPIRSNLRSFVTVLSQHSSSACFKALPLCGLMYFAGPCGEVL